MQIDADALTAYLEKLDLDGIVERTRQRVQADAASPSHSWSEVARIAYWHGVRLGAVITRDWFLIHVRRHAVKEQSGICWCPRCGRPHAPRLDGERGDEPAMP